MTVAQPARRHGNEPAQRPVVTAAAPASVRPYLSAEQLAAVTPWSVNGIWKMVGRGVLKRDVHYFRPLGRRREIVFKWTAIVALIEGAQSTEPEQSEARKGMDVQQAAKELERLLG